MRYERMVEDRGVPTFPNAVFILANYNVVCFHPTRPIVVAAGWSHRYPQTITPQVGDSDADVYLNTLRFIGDKETPPAPVTPTLGSTVFSDDFTGSSNWIKYDNEFVLARYRGPTGPGWAGAPAIQRTFEQLPDFALPKAALQPKAREEV